MKLSRVAVRDTAQPCPQVPARRRGQKTRLAVAAAASALASVTMAAPALAANSHVTPSPTYQFTTLDNQSDPTFNQLLGINKHGVIAGYFGAGTAGHSNQGYVLDPPYGQGSYMPENFPGSVQTQVTGLNDHGVTVGFWSNTDNGNNMDANFAFWAAGGRFHNVDIPVADPADPAISQLLGVNDYDVAVGFYNDNQGDSHGFTYNLLTGTYKPVTIANSTSVSATAINNHFDIAGSYTNPTTNNTDGFVLTPLGRLIDLAVPNASSTVALGINDHLEVVGVYTVGSAMHGFTWTPLGGFTTVDDPNGIGTTTINGVNDAGDLVGFYVDAAGNTDGMLAEPASTL